MPDDDIKDEPPSEVDPEKKAQEKSTARVDWLKAVAMPLVTLVLGFWFNATLGARQEHESNVRLYAEMMGRREEADSALRKDMFQFSLNTFMHKEPELKLQQQLEQEVLNLELLAYNFHESLDIGPLFKHERSRIPNDPEGPNADLRARLEKVALEVNERQLAGLSDGGTVERGGASLDKIKDAQAFLIFFGPNTVEDPTFKPGEGTPLLCLSMDSTDADRHYRQFKLELIEYDPVSREVRVRLYASKPLEKEQCHRPDLDPVANKEIDILFWIGLFDLPMIDNTRLSHGERCAVSLSQLTTAPPTVQMAIAYFPGSRASLKDKPYYDEVVHDLVHEKQSSQAKEP
jgi:hypothetical protein